MDQGPGPGPRRLGTSELYRLRRRRNQVKKIRTRPSSLLPWWPLSHAADARRQSQRERESVRESVPSAVTVAASHAFCPAHPEPPSVAPTAKGWPRRHGSSGSPSRVPSRPFPDRSVDACYTEANRSRSVLQPASSGFGGFASPSPASRSSARKAEERGAKGEGQGREAQQEGGVAPGSSFVFVWNFDH